MNVDLRHGACDEQRLEAFLSGRLSALQERELAAHLTHCASCRRALQQQAAEPAAWREAQELLRPGEFDSPNADEHPEFDIPLRSTRQPPQIQAVIDALGPTDDPAMLGRLGGYEVSGVVGAGGMGVVLKASDRSLDRTVAIKVLAPHLATSGAARQRFAREAKAAAAVLHPNVIAIHSVSNDEALPYLVMPYVRGASLQKRLDAEGPLRAAEILRIGAQIAAGLAAAHAQGLVHRDIKPANILLEDGVERVAITDFGLARAVDDATLTQSGAIAGTPQYMSPEQARGEPVDGRSDLFSLGSVLYAMCTGRPPFRAETSYGVLRRITDDEPMSIREINPDIPDWLAAIVARLMAKRAGDRFGSATEVAELLEGCLAHVQQPGTAPLPDVVRSLRERSEPRERSLADHESDDMQRDSSLLRSRSERTTSELTSIWKGLIAMLAISIFAVAAALLWQAAQGPSPQPAANNGNAAPPAAGNTAPEAAAMPKRIRQFPSSGAIEAIACSTDGKLIAVSSGQPYIPGPEVKRTVEVLDETGKIVVSLKLTTPEEDAAVAATEKLTSFERGPLAFSPDGKLLAVATGLGQVKLYNPRTGEVVRSLDDAKGKLAETTTPPTLKTLRRAMGGVNTLAFSPDSSLLVTTGTSFDDFARGWDGIDRLGLLTTGPGRLKVWDVKTGALQHDLPFFSHAEMAAFSPDGIFLACAGRWAGGGDHGTGVIVWNRETQAKVRTMLEEANGGTHVVTFAPNKKLVAISSLQFDKENDTRSMSVSIAWPVSGIMEWRQTFPGTAKPFAFLPDGKTVLVHCWESIKFLDVASGVARHELKQDDPKAQRWTDIAFAPQAQLLVIGSRDAQQKGSIEIWDVTGH